MPDAEHVSVAGSWDGWNTHDLTLRTDSTGVWEITLALDPGVYEYRFILNGSRWIRDPRNPSYGGSHSNSLLRVGYERSPEIDLVDPRPGSLIRSLPAVFVIRYIPGADNAPVDRARSSMRIGNLEKELRIDHKDSTRLFAEFDSLPEGEITAHAAVTSRTGHGDSLDALFLVNCLNQKPVARTEGVISAPTGQSVTIDGGLSYDPDGELLADFRWEVLFPDSVEFSQGTHGPYPHFVPRSDLTALSLSVSDGDQWSEPDTAYVFSSSVALGPHVFIFDPRTTGLESMDITSVTVPGTWNGWREDRDSLFHQADGSWRAPLHPGPGVHEYQYCINDTLRIANPVEPVRGSNNLHISRSRWRNLPRFDLGSDETGPMSGQVHEPGSTGAILISSSGNTCALPPERLVSFPLPEIGTNRLHTHILQVQPEERYRPVRILDFRDEFGERHTRNLDKVPAWSRDAVIAWLPRTSFSDLSFDLSFIASLGVNTVWLPPVLPSPMEHGYAPLDHFTIDTTLGSPEELRTFINRAHGLGIRVLLDFVANHTSDQTVRFRSARTSSGQWHSWYGWREDGSPHHWFHWDQLVNLDLSNPTVRRHLLSSASFLRGFGIDGFRLDVAWALPIPFITQLRTESRFRSADFLLLGEVIPREPRFHSTALDMSYDTDFYGLILDLLEGQRIVADIPSHWSEISSRYPPEATGMLYIENHDTERLRDRYDGSQCDVAGFMMFTWPGSPMILASPDGSAGSLSHELIRRFIEIRRSYAALRSASIRWMEAGKNLLAYYRPGSPPCLVFVNPSDERVTGTIGELPGPNGRPLLWVPVLNVGPLPALNQRGSRLDLECLPWSGCVLVPEPFVRRRTGDQE